MIKYKGLSFDSPFKIVRLVQAKTMVEWYEKFYNRLRKFREGVSYNGKYIRG